jgi:hypothetical protein
LPQVVVGPSSAAKTFVVSVTEKTSPLRYRLQARYYDIFKRSKRTPDKLPCGEQSGETEEQEEEENLGKSRGRKRKKTFGVLASRTFPKMSKTALERDTTKLGEISEAEAPTRLLELASAIQRILTQMSASSLKSSCPLFFSSSKYLQQHMAYLTEGNDIFRNCTEHFEFQMELMFQFLLVKLPKADRIKVCCHN